MDIKLPLLRLGEELYYVDRPNGLFRHTVDSANVILINEVHFVEPERRFLLLYDHARKKALPFTDFGDGLTKSTKLYAFPGLDKLSPVVQPSSEMMEKEKTAKAESVPVTVARTVKIPRDYYKKKPKENKKLSVLSAAVGRILGWEDPDRKSKGKGK